MRYLLRLLDKTDPGASLKHAAYLLVVVAAIVWLTFQVVHRAMDANWVASFGALIAAVTTSKVMGKGAEGGQQ